MNPGHHLSGLSAMSVPAPLGLLDLSDCILQQCVFPFLTGSELARCARLSKRLRSLVTEDAVWRRPTEEELGAAPEAAQQVLADFLQLRQAACCFSPSSGCGAGRVTRLPERPSWRTQFQKRAQAEAPGLNDVRLGRARTLTLFRGCLLGEILAKSMANSAVYPPSVATEERLPALDAASYNSNVNCANCQIFDSLYGLSSLEDVEGLMAASGCSAVRFVVELENLQTGQSALVAAKTTTFSPQTATLTATITGEAIGSTAPSLSDSVDGLMIWMVSISATRESAASESQMCRCGRLKLRKKSGGMSEQQPPTDSRPPSSKVEGLLETCDSSYCSMCKKVAAALLDPRALVALKHRRFVVAAEAIYRHFRPDAAEASTRRRSMPADPPLQWGDAQARNSSGWTYFLSEAARLGGADFTLLNSPLPDEGEANATHLRVRRALSGDGLALRLHIHVASVVARSLAVAPLKFDADRAESHITKGSAGVLSLHLQMALLQGPHMQSDAARAERLGVEASTPLRRPAASSSSDENFPLMRCCREFLAEVAPLSCGDTPDSLLVSAASSCGTHVQRCCFSLSRTQNVDLQKSFFSLTAAFLPCGKSLTHSGLVLQIHSLKVRNGSNRRGGSLRELDSVFVLEVDVAGPSVKTDLVLPQEVLNGGLFLSYYLTDDKSGKSVPLTFVSARPASVVDPFREARGANTPAYQNRRDTPSTTGRCPSVVVFTEGLLYDADVPTGLVDTRQSVASLLTMELEAPPNSALFKFRRLRLQLNQREVKIVAPNLFRTLTAPCYKQKGPRLRRFPTVYYDKGYKTVHEPPLESVTLPWSVNCSGPIQARRAPDRRNAYQRRRSYMDQPPPPPPPLPPPPAFRRTRDSRFFQQGQGGPLSSEVSGGLTPTYGELYNQPTLSLQWHCGGSHWTASESPNAFWDTPSFRLHNNGFKTSW